MDESFGLCGDELAERRYRYRLRSVFDSALAMLEPFFDPASGWEGLPLQHLTFRIVRENFPELTSEEVHSMVGALRRAYDVRSSSPEIPGQVLRENGCADTPASC